jgi:hypothetical protein
MSYKIRVQYDSAGIRLFENDKEAWSVLWSDIERIGYRSTDEGPCADDHFLVFKNMATPPLYYNVSLSWEGAIELSGYVDAMEGTRIPIEGNLANVTVNKTVTVWPSIHSGEPL